MTAFSSTKSLKASVASALALGAFAATPAFAQFNTTALVPTTDNSARVAAPATGNTETLTAYQLAVATAFAAGNGGDINFDNALIPGTALATSVTASYGLTQGSTLTITQNIPLGINPVTGIGTGAGNYSTGQDVTNQTSGTAVAGNYFGYSNVDATSTTYNFDFNFSQKLSDFGIFVINRGAARSTTFTVTLSNGSVVTPTTAFPTSNGTLSFFEYAPTGGLTISGVNFATSGYTRFDDMGFVVAPAATPEPSQYAAMGLGVLGLGLLALRARKRTVMGS